MNFVKHPSNTRVLGAPPEWDQKNLECGALPVTDVNISGIPGMASFWEPNEQDLANLLAGGKVKLTILGNSHPPVMVEVVSA